MGAAYNSLNSTRSIAQHSQEGFKIERTLFIMRYPLAGGAREDIDTTYVAI